MKILPKEVTVVQKLILVMAGNLSTPRDSFAFSVLCAKLLIQICCVALETKTFILVLEHDCKMPHVALV